MSLASFRTYNNGSGRAVTLEMPQGSELCYGSLRFPAIIRPCRRRCQTARAWPRAADGLHEPLAVRRVRSVSHEGERGWRARLTYDDQGRRSLLRVRRERVRRTACLSALSRG